MTTPTPLPSRAALIEAARRAGYKIPEDACRWLSDNEALALAARLIEQYEPHTLVDDDERELREVLADWFTKGGFSVTAESYRNGETKIPKFALHIYRAGKAARERGRG